MLLGSKAQLTSIGKFEWHFLFRSLTFRCHHSNTDCMNSTFHAVLTLGFIFIEEIEPCQFEIQNFSVASSVKFQNSGHGQFQFVARVMF